MKLRADLKLVKQSHYIPKTTIDITGDKCLGCVFAATRMFDNSLCERINSNSLTCGADTIWVFEDDKSNFRMEGNNGNTKANLCTIRNHCSYANS